jgi:pilus assembly protein CpaE
VALVDLDLQNGDCALALEIKPTPGLGEALANPLRIDNTLLERIMSPAGTRLFVLSSEEPLNDDLHFTAAAVETLVSVLREQFHYVILDIPRIQAAPYRRALELADFRIVVADQTLRSVRDTVRLRRAWGEGDGKLRDLLVVNRHGEGGRHAVTLQEMQHVLDVKPKIIVPFQPALFTTVTGSTRIAAARRGKFGAAIAALALGLSGGQPERRRWWRAEK